jgi:hypothetical protein
MEASLSTQVSDRIMDMVRHELVENPDVENTVLYEKATLIDPEGMTGVDRRQFNARYPLQVKRREMGPRPKKPPGPPKARRRPRRAAAGADGAGAAAPVGVDAAGSLSVLRTLAREGVRDVLLRFAQDLANAESRGELVGVVASVDQYVDQILGMGSFPE